MKVGKFFFVAEVFFDKAKPFQKWKYSTNSEEIVDRHRNDRKVGFWRIAQPTQNGRLVNSSFFLMWKKRTASLASLVMKTSCAESLTLSMSSLRMTQFSFSALKSYWMYFLRASMASTMPIVLLVAFPRLIMKIHH